MCEYIMYESIMNPRSSVVEIGNRWRSFLCVSMMMTRLLLNFHSRRNTDFFERYVVGSNNRKALYLIVSSFISSFPVL